MRHRELLRPLPPIKQMQSPTREIACFAARVSRVPRRGGMYCTHTPLCQGGLAGTNPARVGSADQSPARRHVRGREGSV